MTPSSLVTSGGVRRHTARGMKKITKAALAGGAAAVALATTRKAITVIFGAILALLVLAGCGGESKSYQAGYEDGADATGVAAQMLSMGLNRSNACDTAMGVGHTMFGAPSWFDSDDYMDGCLDGLEA
jgi:hypothetical protein